KVQKLEEKGVKLRGAGGEKKSFIDLVKGHDDYKALQEKKQASAQIDVQKGEMASMLETKVTSAGIVAPVYDPVIEPGVRQELMIRDLIPTTPVTQGNAFTYFKELLHTRGAATVAEGGTKPTSNVTFEEVTDTVKKIAVWMPVT